jgi:hypothetical protein
MIQGILNSTYLIHSVTVSLMTLLYITIHF